MNNRDLCRSAGIPYVPEAPDARMQSLWDKNAGTLRRIPRARFISDAGWRYIGIARAAAVIAIGAICAVAA